MRNKIIIISVFVFIFAVAGTDAGAQNRKTQSVKINIAVGGYQPTSFRLKKGIRARITFTRTTEDTCGNEVVFPAYNIRRSLPLNQPVTITFTPKKGGTFSFVCGMNMMRGKMIVQ